MPYTRHIAKKLPLMRKGPYENTLYEGYFVFLSHESTLFTPLDGLSVVKL